MEFENENKIKRLLIRYYSSIIFYMDCLVFYFFKYFERPRLGLYVTHSFPLLSSLAFFLSDSLNQFLVFNVCLFAFLIPNESLNLYFAFCVSQLFLMSNTC